MSRDRFLVGTRGSSLALKQTAIVIAALTSRHPSGDFQVVPIRTPGDRVSDEPISLLGDKGVFVQPLAEQLLAKKIDIAVHSLKDVPGDGETEGLEIGALLPRNDARDALVSRLEADIHTLRAGATVGTGSLRRKVQLEHLRPDLDVQPVRGNVDTRLRKLDAGEYDALILAAAGLDRLGLRHRISQLLDPQNFVPDPGQGIIAVQVRVDSDAASLVAELDDSSTRWVALAERAVARGLNADCRSPVGAYAWIENGRINLVAMAASHDLKNMIREEAEGDIEDAEDLGCALGKGLLSGLSA